MFVPPLGRAKFDPKGLTPRRSLPAGQVQIYNVPVKSVTISSAIFDDGTNIKPLDEIIGQPQQKKCDGVGCRDGKVLLFTSFVDCDKCGGKGML